MALWAAAGVVLGAAVVAALRREPAPTRAESAEMPVSAPNADVEALRGELAIQQTVAQSLQAEVAQLRGEVQELRARLDREQPEGGAPGADAMAEPEHPARAWFDAPGLLELGVDPSHVAALRERFDAHQLDVLYLRDQAAREGWANRPRFANEVTSLRTSLRQELGDEDTDLMLWATGQFNRVELASVLTGSPAVAAGLQSGDVVVRYDDQRIFDGRELQQATRAGEAGELVAVDVDRDGQELRFYLPRGPLGVQLRPTRRPPEPR